MKNVFIVMALSVLFCMFSTANAVESVNITAPANNSVITTDNVNITFSVVDTSSYYGYQIYFNDNLKYQSGASETSAEITKNIAGLTDGVYDVYVHIYIGGYVDSPHISLIVDMNPPEVTINNPDVYYNVNSSIINVSVNDATSVVVSAEIDGLENITLTETDGYFVNSSYEFSEGPHVVRIYAVDELGRMNSNENLTFTVDITNPTVLINTENIINSRNIAVNISANDNLAFNCTNISVINSETGVLITSAINTTNGTYQVVLTVPEDGIYNVTATAYDMAGNVNETEPLRVIVDTTAPEVTSNVLRTVYGINSSILNISASDLTSISVIAEIDGLENITLTETDGYFVNSSYEFIEGPHVVRIYANDSLGNVNSSETVTFRVDLTVPAFNVFTVEGTYFNNGSNVLNFTVDELYLDTVTAFNGSDEITLDNSTGNYLNAITLADGVYNVTISVNDTAGNENSTYVSFTVDTVNPEVTINTVERSYNYNTSILNVTVTDINLDSVVAEINGAENITLTETDGYFVTNESFSEGLYNVTIIAMDLAGNVNSSETVTFRVDLTAPVITVNTEDGAYFNNGSNVLDFTVIENNIDTVTAFNGSDEITLDNSTGNYLNALELADGVYNVTMTANDTAGNSANETVMFTVDTVNPEVTIISPADGSRTSGSSTTIIVAANDSLSGVSSVVAQIGSVRTVTLELVGGYYTGSTGRLSNGNYDIIITATDLAGNVNSSETTSIRIAIPNSNSKNSDASGEIESEAIRNFVSGAAILYGSIVDRGYAEQLKDDVQNGKTYELSGDAIIVGGPKSNGFANNYGSEFGIPITNENPGKNKGVIQVKNIEVRDGNIIKTYQVIYIAGSDRLGTLAALEYFKTLAELPTGPITVEWTENGPIIVE